MMPRRLVYGLIGAVTVAGVLAWMLWPDGDGEGKQDEPAPRLDGGEREATLPRSGAERDDALRRVEGHARDVLTGDPVPYVDIVLRSAGAETATTSTGDGSFSAEVPEGAYEVQAGGKDVFGLKQGRLTVGRDAPTRFDVWVTRLIKVAGRAVDDKGAAVEGVEVSFSTKAPRRRLSSGDVDVGGTASTDRDGGFEINVIPGEVVLVADHERVKSYVTLGAVAVDKRGVMVKIERAASVYGVVVGDKGQPVDATVYASVAAPAIHEYEKQSARTDERGRFGFDRITPGKLTIEARADRGGDVEPLNLRLEPGAVRDDIKIALPPPRALGGRVVDGQGTPIAGAYVTAVRAGSRMPLPSGRTDDRGAFRLEGLGNGPYEVIARVSGTASTRMAGVTPPRDDLELRLSSARGIRGTVRASTGGPVTSFIVRIDRWRSPGEATAHAGKPGGVRFSGPAGEFELPIAAPGSYDLVVSARGFGPARVEGVAVPEGGWGKAEVTLGPSAMIRGSVLASATRKGVARAQVEAEGYDGPPVYTDENGQFVISDVSPGTRKLVISRQGFVTAHKSGVEVKAGETVQVDVMLAAAK